MACAMRALGLRARHVEMNPDACATLRAAGFEDVVQSDLRHYPSWVPPRSERVLLVHGSPPCPLWSQATHPERRGLAVDGWPWFLRAVRWMQPELVTVENVRGAPVGTWLADLRDSGYLAAAWRLNAKDYGDPQVRIREILIASLHQLPEMPVPTHGPGLLPYRTLGECLDPVAGRVVHTEGRAGSEPWRLDLPSPTVTTCEVKGTRASASSGWTFNGGPDRASDATFLATGLRRVSIAEAARLQGFPEGHPFQGTTTETYRQAGNACPVGLSTAMLRAALATLP